MKGKNSPSPKRCVVITLVPGVTVTMDEDPEAITLHFTRPSKWEWERIRRPGGKVLLKMAIEQESEAL